MNDNIAIVTARGGSKGIPQKNIKLLAGKHLIGYTIEAALQSRCFKKCIVTTDDESIAEVSKKFGAEVIIRPAHLATDTASSQDVVAHVLVGLAVKPSCFTMLQPTSPLRDANDIRNFLSFAARKKSKCCMSVTELEHPIQKVLKLENNFLVPLFDQVDQHMPRQKLAKMLRANGAMYFMDTELFLKNMTFFVPPVLPFIMPTNKSIDIDTPLDLAIAELLLRDLSLL